MQRNRLIYIYISTPIEEWAVWPTVGSSVPPLYHTTTVAVDSHSKKGKKDRYSGKRTCKETGQKHAFCERKGGQTSPGIQGKNLVETSAAVHWRAWKKESQQSIRQGSKQGQSSGERSNDLLSLTHLCSQDSAFSRIFTTSSWPCFRASSNGVWPERCNWCWLRHHVHGSCCNFKSHLEGFTCEASRVSNSATLIQKNNCLHSSHQLFKLLQTLFTPHVDLGWSSISRDKPSWNPRARIQSLPLTFMVAFIDCGETCEKTSVAHHFGILLWHSKLKETWRPSNSNSQTKTNYTLEMVLLPDISTQEKYSRDVAFK